MGRQNDKPKDRRQTYIVDKHYQFNTVMRNILYMLSVGVILSLPFIYFIKTTSFLMADHSEELQTMIRQQQKITIISVAFYLAAFIVASTIFTIWRTHKLIGPLKKFKRCMKGISAGDFTIRVELRSGDKLVPLADTFNKMVEKLGEREKLRNEAFLKFASQAKAELAKSSSPDILWETLDRLEMEINDTFGNGTSVSEKMEIEAVTSPPTH